MDCEFVVNGIDEELERRPSGARTGWESVIFEVDDEPEPDYFDSDS